MPQARAAIANPSGLVRAILRTTLTANDIDVVGEATALPDLVAICRRGKPDVAVTDVRLDGQPLDSCLPDVLQTGARVLVLCDPVPQEILIDLLTEGVSGYLLLSDAAPERVAEAALAVAHGDAALHPAVARAILDQWRAARAAPTTRIGRVALTPRELAVVAALADGLAAKQIAARMVVSIKTVENHKASIFKKLGVRTQTEAVAVAMTNGLLRRDSERAET